MTVDNVQYFTPITTSAARNFFIGSAGATIMSQVNPYNNGASPNLNTIAGNISDSVPGSSGPITLYGYWNYNSTNLTLSGNNSGFSGGINCPNGGTLTLIGSASSGTGPIAFTAFYGPAILNLVGDTSATFVTTNVQLPQTATINVDQATGAGANKTLTLNMVTPPGGATVNITGGHGYSLGIETVTAGGAAHIESHDRQRRDRIDYRQHGLLRFDHAQWNGARQLDWYDNEHRWWPIWRQPSGN